MPAFNKSSALLNDIPAWLVTPNLKKKTNLHKLFCNVIKVDGKT